MSELAHEIALTIPFDQALDRTIEALKEEGFGVLTRVDIHDAFKEKLDVDFRKYSILGACNPPLALQALNARPDAGMMLPCNVTVEDDAQGGSIVRIIDAAHMMKISGLDSNAALLEVGTEAAQRLDRVARQLAR